MKDENLLMTEGSIVRPIVRFAIPLLIGNLLQQSYNLVDLMIVGRCMNDGGLSVAAVGMGGPLIFMMIGFFMGLANGVGIVVSNAYGAGRLDGVKRSIGLAMLFSALIGAAVWVISTLACRWLLTATNTTPEIFDLAETYLKIYFIGYVPALVYNTGTFVLQALGNSRSPFYYLATTCVLNVVLDILFLAVFKMGVGGAAAATVLSQTVAMGLVLWKLFASGILVRSGSQKGAEKPEGQAKDMAAEDPWRTLLRMIRYGLPIAVQQVTVSLSNLILQGYINLLGTQIIAAWSIYGKIDGFLLLPINSFSVAMTTFTGQNYGAGRHERILQAKTCVSRMTIGTSLAMSAAFILLCEPITRLFEDTPTIVEATKEMCYYMMPFYFVLAWMRVYTGLFNGLGKTIYGSAAMIGCMCVARIIFISAVYPLLQTAMAIYIAYLASWALCLAVVMIEYRVKIRKMLAHAEEL